MSYQTNKRWRKKHPSAWQITKRRYYKQFEAEAHNKKQRWTTAEINLVLKKVVSDRCLARWLGRSVKAIQCLRVRMKGDGMIVIINGKEEQRAIDRFEVDAFVPGITVPRTKPIPRLKCGEEAFETLDGKVIIVSNTF